MSDKIAEAIHDFMKSPEGQEYIKKSKEREEAWAMWEQWRAQRDNKVCTCGMCPKHGPPKPYKLELRD